MKSADPDAEFLGWQRLPTRRIRRFADDRNHDGFVSVNPPETVDSIHTVP